MEPKLGVDTKKEEDFSSWYTQVLVKGDMMDYYDIKGCYVLKPWSMFIWKQIQDFVGRELEKMGVQDVYFPMFVTKEALEREKNHVDGFSAEVAWVTRSGKTDLHEPIAIRPTSETIMYPLYSKWLKSHRDLPLKLNQWTSVVRWEFKHPQPFLRTREFLWQEGHTAFYTKEESDTEVFEILELYRRTYEDLLAVPVIKGRKSEHEKFPGGVYTTTVEAFIGESGRAIQAATSHSLGQNFAQMFNIVVEGEHKEKSHVWQNSWGLTTRSIGVMTMIHGDNKGLVLPPRVASIQVIVIPCGITSKTTKEDEQWILESVERIRKALVAVGIRASKDVRGEYTPGWKYNHWELKGVPVRIEVGPRDLQQGQTSVFRRDRLTRDLVPVEKLESSIQLLLQNIHDSMFTRAKTLLDQSTVVADCWDDIVQGLDNRKLILIPWCEQVECELSIKNRTVKTVENRDSENDNKAPSMGAKSICIPLSQPMEVGTRLCLGCDRPAKSYTFFGRSY